jgi:photosystem II stability/assembly factor-like uncharacterized protein
MARVRHQESQADDQRYDPHVIRLRPYVRLALAIAFSGSTLQIGLGSLTALPVGASSPPLTITSSYHAIPAGGRVDAIDCTGGPPCSALLESGARRYFLMTENQLGGWSTSPIGMESQPLAPNPSMSCPNSGICDIAYGNTVSSTHDAGVRWSFSHVSGPRAHVVAISCATMSRCVAIGTVQLRASSHREPMVWEQSGAGTKWTGRALTPNHLVVPAKLSCFEGVGCALAITDRDRVDMFYLPASDGTVDVTEQVRGLSSVRAMSCQVVGGEPECTLVGSGDTIENLQLETVRPNGTAQIYRLRNGATGAQTLGCVQPGICLVPASPGLLLVNTMTGSSAVVDSPSGSPSVDAIGCASEICVFGGTDSDNGVRFDQSNSGGTSFLNGPEDGGPAYGVLMECGASHSCPVLLNGGHNYGLLSYSPTTGHWSRSSFPGTFDPSSGSCASIQWCGVVGTTEGASHSAFAVVTSSGTTSVLNGLPVNAQQLSSQSPSVSCPAVLHCVLVVGSESGPATVATTMDGGKSWAVAKHQIDGTLFDVTIQCADAESCVVGGTTYGSIDSQSKFTSPDVGHLYVSHDGGLTWSQSRLHTSIGHVDGLTCDGATCWAAARDDNASRDGTAVAFLRSSNGGTTWTRTSSPPEKDAVSVESLDCQGVSHCWALLSLHDAIVEVSTDDGGARWQQRVVEATPGLVWQASCSAVNSCVATNNGSAGVLVFRLRSAAPVGLKG